MASKSKRSSVELTKVSKRNPDSLSRLPPPVSSEQFKDADITESHSGILSGVNGEHDSKREDRYGFLYSMSEEEQH